MPLPLRRVPPVRPRNCSRSRRLANFLFLLAICVGSAPLRAADFQPGLSVAADMIAGDKTVHAEIPADAAERKMYPILAERPLPLRTEIPGKSFRQVNPLPETTAWWKFPFYVVIGLPRDCVDAVMGGLHYVPYFNIPFDFLPYEVLPTQILFRDPRDWHRWDFNQNHLGHGYYDGNKWGFFPSLNTWHFTSPSVKQQTKNIAYNNSLQASLNDINRAIEQRNQPMIAAQREARSKALEALAANNGHEAVGRMLPFFRSQAMDDGAYAIWVAALAENADGGPEWVRTMLWSQLAEAQAKQLAASEQLLGQTAAQHPENRTLVEALLYAHLLANKPADAVRDTRTLLVAKNASDARNRRLLFETAMAARDQASAKEALAKITPEENPNGAYEVLQARLNLLSGDVDGAYKVIADFQKAHPEDAYLNYYLGSAELMRAQGASDPKAGYGAAYGPLERAVLLSPNSPLRLRASAALSFVRGELGGPGAKKSTPDLIGFPGGL